MFRVFRFKFIKDREPRHLITDAFFQLGMKCRYPILGAFEDFTGGIARTLPCEAYEH